MCVKASLPARPLESPVLTTVSSFAEVKHKKKITLHSTVNSNNGERCK